jgi:two-component system, LuxR family, response regulator FixJ
MHRASPVHPAIVIVVDDDPAVLNSLKFAFEIEGFDVRAYPSAGALLDNGGLPGRGCLVLDYQMPGMNGLALLKRLRDRGETLPALLITTPNAAVYSQAAAAGVPIVEKPLFGDTLVGKVRDMLATSDVAGRI